MGKIEEKPKVKNKKIRRELRIEKLIAREGEIPNPLPLEKRKRKKIPIIFQTEEGFDFENVHSLLMEDYKFFKKYKKYKEHHNFNLCQEPFSYMYEKKCWEHGFFDKLCILLRKKFRHIHFGPFSASGLCPFFEFETLNSPSKCKAYLSRSQQIMRNRLERLEKAALSFNVDHYDADGGAEMVDDSPLVPPNSPVCIRNKKIRMFGRKADDGEGIVGEEMEGSRWSSDSPNAEDVHRIRRER